MFFLYFCRNNDYYFYEKIFRIGECEPSDAAIAEILPPISRFKAGLLAETKLRVTEKLKDFFIRYFD